MTGTVISSSNAASVNVGDRIAWTLQYDRSLAPLLPSQGMYTSSVPVLSNIIDRTNGSSFFAPSFAGELPAAFLTLQRGVLPSTPGSFSVQSSWGSLTENANASLWLMNTSGTLPTTDLAGLHLNTIPFDLRTLNYNYLPTRFLSVTGFGFVAQVDPLSSPISPAPEPGALTLFVLGATGLLARRLGA